MKPVILKIALLLATLAACDVVEEAHPNTTLAFREEPEEVLVATKDITLEAFAKLVLACDVDVLVRPTLTGYAPNGADEERVAGLGVGMLIHVQEYNCWRKIMVDELEAEVVP